LVQLHIAPQNPKTPWTNRSQLNGVGSNLNSNYVLD